MRKYLEKRRFRGQDKSGTPNLVPSRFDVWLFRRFGCPKDFHWLVWAGCKKNQKWSTAYWKCLIPGFGVEKGSFPEVHKVKG